jgi:hypothetical protein
MDGKLWIIGDSFTMRDIGRYGENSWVEICSKAFKDGNYYVSSMGSRDIQTVFDIFLENLHKIKPNDFVILMLPTLTRFRLPLANPYIDCVYTSDIGPGGNPKHTNFNSMIGDKMYTSIIDTITSVNLTNEKALEWPLNQIDPKMFVPNGDIRYPNLADIMHLINSSKVMTNNWNSILKSIKSYAQFKLLCYSWTNELDPLVVNTRDIITDRLGVWETLKGVWNKTNGEKGDKNDLHWSEDMNIRFAEDIIKSYPQYFGYESKII